MSARLPIHTRFFAVGSITPTQGRNNQFLLAFALLP